jgi:Domain of unknown function (DUF2703)
MKPLTIVWQRLVKDGETCGRCGSTREAVTGALAKLEAALGPLGIQPVLETRVLDEAAFRADPSASNRIWIADKPMEEWLGASVGMSPCCSVCGDLPCRTMEVAGTSFEAIPEDLIVKATLIAAARMVEPTQPQAASSACCSSSCSTACG